MKKLTEQEILRIAKLAQIEIPETELSQRLEEFNRVLSFTDKLAELDVGSVTALGQIRDAEGGTPLAEDLPHASFSEAEALSNAPDRQDFFFKVPRMIGEKTP